MSSHNSQVRPRPARAAQCPATSKTPAASAISATTVIATRRARTGLTRVARSVRADPVSARSYQGSTAGPVGQAWSAWSRNVGPRRAPEPSPSWRRHRPRTDDGSRGRGCVWPCASRPGHGSAPIALPDRLGEPRLRHTCSSGSRRSRQPLRQSGGRWRAAPAIRRPGGRARRGSRPWTDGMGAPCRRGAGRRTEPRRPPASGSHGVVPRRPSRAGRRRRRERRCRGRRRVPQVRSPGGCCARCPRGGSR